MRIVVTGALGHIGSALIRRLAAAFPGSEMLLLDNLATQRYCSLFNLPRTATYRFIEGDILTADLRAPLAGADALVHLAALTDAVRSLELGLEFQRVNVQGTERVARACVDAGVPMVFLSTTSVYGSQTDVVDESTPVEELRPQSPYAESKLQAESVLRELGRREGLRFVTCRFGTIFGPSPGMRFHTAVNKFVWQACNGEPITVWRAALHQQRPYLELREGVRALLFLLGRLQFDSKTYNVLTANATVAEIVDVIRARIPDVRTVLVDSPIMNQLSYTVSRSRFEALGFRFRGSLQRGIAASVEMLRALRNGHSPIECRP